MIFNNSDGNTTAQGGIIILNDDGTVTGLPIGIAIKVG
jgi:predicted phosphoribosyltransferase